MTAQHIEFHAVNRITIGTIGEPGQRVFLLQVADAIDTVTLKMEKEQARALGKTSQKMLENLDEEHPATYTAADYPSAADLQLKEPTEILFAIGQMGLGYDSGRDRVVLAAQEAIFSEDEEPSTARLWITRPQLEALSDQALEVIEQGRPSPDNNGYHRYPL